MYWLGGYCPIQALPARALHVETVRQLKVNKRQTPGCEGNQQAMTTQVNRCIENLRRVEAIKGCVLDQDETLADLIGARSYKPHPEAGYTTDNLLLSLTVECLAMREETIYVPPGAAPARRRKRADNAGVAQVRYTPRSTLSGNVEPTCLDRTRQACPRASQSCRSTRPKCEQRNAPVGSMGASSCCPRVRPFRISCYFRTYRSSSE